LPGTEAAVDLTLPEVVAEVAALAKTVVEEERLGLQTDLERQDIIPVGAYVRTCDCADARSVVR